MPSMLQRLDVKYPNDGSALHVILVTQFCVYCTAHKQVLPSSGGQQHAMVIRDVCPRYKVPQIPEKWAPSQRQAKSGTPPDCGRQFVQCFAPYLIADDTRELIERLLLERLSLRGMCRAVGGTLQWLLGFLAFHCVEAFPHPSPPANPSLGHGDVIIQRLEGEADEMPPLCAEAGQHAEGSQ